jgi:hypothetical protein
MAIVKQFIGNLEAGLRRHHRFRGEYGAHDHNIHGLTPGLWDSP